MKPLPVPGKKYFCPDTIVQVIRAERGRIPCHSVGSPDGRGFVDVEYLTLEGSKNPGVTLVDTAESFLGHFKELV